DHRVAQRGKAIETGILAERVECVLDCRLVGRAAIVGEHVGVGSSPESTGVNGSRLVPHPSWHCLASRIVVGGTARGTLGQSIESDGVSAGEWTRSATNLRPPGAA